MKIQIVLREQLDKCGDEYLDERDIPMTFEDNGGDYLKVEMENRTFFVKRKDICSTGKFFDG